jgi:hypothetical protein
MKTKERTYNPVYLAVFSAFVSLYLVLFGPLDIFVHNSEEFSSTLVELVSILLLMAGISFVLILTVLLLSPRVIRIFIFKGLAFLVLSSWVISNYFYGDYGQLDGTPLVIDSWSPLALAQSAVLILLVLLVARLEINSVLKLTGLVFLMGLVSSAIGLSSLEVQDSDETATLFPAALTQFSPSKNVLHVVLDELGSNLFIHTIESDERLKKAFDGFTVFSDTLSVYPSTEMAIVALMTGEVYRNGEPKKDFRKKARKKNEGIVRLESLGYELDSHTRCQLGVLKHCTMITSRILNEDIADIEALQLLDIFLFKSAPDYIKPDIYNEEKWLLLDMSSHNGHLKFQSGVAHLLFEKFLEEISVADNGKPRYKFFHSMVTHSPTDLSADCDIVDEDERSNVTEIEFVKCGLGHFVSLLKKLRKLGIYDETMIILSSDHGDYWLGAGMKFSEFKSRGVRPGMVTRAHATLAIKPFKSRGPMTVTPAPVSLRDIPHTILAANGLEQEESASPGTRDVFSVGETEEREREFLFYIWEHKYWSEELLPPITTLKINGKIQDPQSWPDLSSRAQLSEQ